MTLIFTRTWHEWHWCPPERKRGSLQGENEDWVDGEAEGEGEGRLGPGRHHGHGRHHHHPHPHAPSLLRLQETKAIEDDSKKETLIAKDFPSPTKPNWTRVKHGLTSSQQLRNNTLVKIFRTITIACSNIVISIPNDFRWWPREKKRNYTRVRWCFLRHIADVWCDVGDEWCEVAGDVGNAGSKARSVSHHLKQPEGAAQGGWQWDWSWVSQLMIMKLIHVLELLSRPVGYTSQHKQHRWQKTGHKVDKQASW